MISSKSGRCPGSTQPPGETIRATLTPAWPEFTRAFRQSTGMSAHEVYLAASRAAHELVIV